ncbi:MAG: aldo/keto reductase [Kiritimatiellaeota bacterium]|nr:aldo/keto reductase [Kiritimatiellota bacterium]
MEYRTLGKTGLSVSRLGFGALFVASVTQGDAGEAHRAIRRARECGVNFFDTAPGYGDSEKVLGEGLCGVERDGIIVETKLGGRPQPFLPQDRDGLMRSIEESLKNLKSDRIDLVLIHEPDRADQYNWWTDWEKVEGPVLDVLAELKRQGVIKYTGLGGTGTTHLAHLVRSGKFDVVLSAFNYSLLYREAALEVFPAAKATGTGIILGSPLQQGATAARFDAVMANPPSWMSRMRVEQFKALYRFLDDIDMPIHEAGLRFVLSNADVDCVLMGSRDVGEVEANVAAVEKGALPKDVLARLDEIAAMVPFRPYGEPFSMGWAMRSPYEEKRLGLV